MHFYRQFKFLFNNGSTRSLVKPQCQRGLRHGCQISVLLYTKVAIKIVLHKYITHDITLILTYKFIKYLKLIGNQTFTKVWFPTPTDNVLSLD